MRFTGLQKLPVGILGSQTPYPTALPPASTLMRRRLPILVALLATATLAGSIFPTLALAVNEKGNEKKIDAAKNGFLGFTFRTSLPDASSAELRNLDDGNKMRILLTPQFSNSIGFFIGPIRIAEKKLEKEVVTRTAVLQQLPPGRYQLTHFSPSKQTGYTVANPDTITIENGKITSLGALVVDAEVVPLVNIVKSFSVKTEGALPDSAYASFASVGLKDLPVLHDSVEWSRR